MITQNVDGLHNKAASAFWNPQDVRRNILELHGTLHRVKCSHEHTVDRDAFQEMLSAANPQWKQFIEDMERTGEKPRTNPDGDVSSLFRVHPLTMLTM
jgi:NAD-dependent deacetylase sirtuin 4